MSFELLIPAVVAIVAGLTPSLIWRRVWPPLAVRVLSILAVVAALSVLWAVLVPVLSLVLEMSGESGRPSWCRSLVSSHDVVPPLVGAAALAALVAMIYSALRAESRWRSAVRKGRPDHRDPIAVVPSSDIVAYSVPGEPGQVVVSAGMLELLDADEREVMLAHERSHLRRHHHRYLRAGNLAAGVVPLLRPLFGQLRFATERWADEDAAAAVGDRRLVARAIARAALAGSSEPSMQMALSNTGVAARVRSLLDGQTREMRGARAAPIAGACALLVGVVAASTQLHHLLEFGAHLCGVS